LERYLCFSYAAEEKYMAQNEPFCTLKTDLQKIFLTKTNSVLQGNNVPVAPASNINGFLWRDTCVASTQLNRPLEQSEPFTTLKYISCSKYSFQKLTQFSQG
jgi:hypothetical protein